MEKKDIEKFKSPWADEIIAYLKEKEASGFVIRCYISKLLMLDKYICEKNLSEKIFTPEMAAEIRLKRNNESLCTRYSRVNMIKNFWIYVSKKGFKVSIPRDVSRKFPKFTPYIYTEEEVNRYFKAVDTYDYGKAKRTAIMLPVLFRLLVCYGLRIGEALHMRKCDLDFENRIIKITKSKSGRERYLPMTDDIFNLLQKYADKTFYLIGENGCIFPGLHSDRRNLDKSAISRYHIEFLYRAGIPYKGEHKGPRIHDFRHYAAIHAVKQMVDSGMDLYTSLPYLTQFLGHSSTQSSEYYLRLAKDLFPYLSSKMDEAIEKLFKDVEAEDDID